jgi:hypothetical protein
VIFFFEALYPKPPNSKGEKMKPAEVVAQFEQTLQRYTDAFVEVVQNFNPLGLDILKSNAYIAQKERFACYLAITCADRFFEPDVTILTSIIAEAFCPHGMGEEQELMKIIKSMGYAIYFKAVLN